MAQLNSIANRLTPSVPMEITFGAQALANGRKFTTLFGHMTSGGGTGVPYQVYNVVAVGDPTAAKLEVDTLAGVDSQISKMAKAFVDANVQAGRSNFPAFRVVLIPLAETSFGPSNEAIEAVKFIRSDMFVSCYPASDTANKTKLLTLCQLISGIDRDLNGQFGSFMTLGSLDALATAVAYNINSRQVLVAYLQDTNTEVLNIVADTTVSSATLTNVTGATLLRTGDIASGSPNVTNVSSIAGIYPGALITGAGIPASTHIKQIVGTTLILTANATATTTGDSLTIVNDPGTSGVYPGAVLSGAGIPVGTTVVSVTKTSILMSAAATATASAETVGVANQVSQPAEIVAAAHAAGCMSFGQPYIPLQGVTIGGLIQPRKKSDWIIIDPNGASEQALAAGLSPLYPQAAGTVGFIRTRTTYNLLPDNVTAATSYIDWQELVALYDFREAIYGVSQNPPFNNNPGGTKASDTVAALFKDEVIRVAKDYEDIQIFTNVSLSAKYFIVQPSTSSRGRFDFRIPVQVLPGLFVIAGNIVAVDDLNTFINFTL